MKSNKNNKNTKARKRKNENHSLMRIKYYQQKVQQKKKLIK